MSNWCKCTCKFLYFLWRGKLDTKTKPKQAPHYMYVPYKTLHHGLMCTSCGKWMNGLDCHHHLNLDDNAQWQQQNIFINFIQQNSCCWSPETQAIKYNVCHHKSLILTKNFTRLYAILTWCITTFIIIPLK